MSRSADATSTPGDPAWLVLRISADELMVSSHRRLADVRAHTRGKLWIPVAAFQGDPVMTAEILCVERLPYVVPLSEGAAELGAFRLEPEARPWLWRAYRKAGSEGRVLLGKWLHLTGGFPDKPVPPPLPKPRSRPWDGTFFDSKVPGRCPGCGVDFPAGERLRMFKRRAMHAACATRKAKELVLIRREYEEAA